jgi:hypothetical protein
MPRYNFSHPGRCQEYGTNIVCETKICFTRAQSGHAALIFHGRIMLATVGLSRRCEPISSFGDAGRDAESERRAVLSYPPCSTSENSFEKHAD